VVQNHGKFDWAFLELTGERKSAKLTVMSKLTQREFLRHYPKHRAAAMKGRSVIVETNGGHQFAFICLTAKALPQRAAQSVPRKVWEKWDLDGPAEPPENWEANQ
jgi:hypothetical protein